MALFEVVWIVHPSYRLKYYWLVCKFRGPPAYMACFMAIVVCVALTADTSRVPSAPPPHTVHHPGSGQRKQGRQLHQQVPAVQEHAAAALTTGPGRTSVCLSVCPSGRSMLPFSQQSSVIECLWNVCIVRMWSRGLNCTFEYLRVSLYMFRSCACIVLSSVCLV